MVDNSKSSYKTSNSPRFCTGVFLFLISNYAIILKSRFGGLKMENREVLEALKDFGRVYIVGSFAIYKALCIDSAQNNDIDIVVKTNIAVSKIRKRLEDLGGTFVENNNHKGFRINYRGQLFDIWRIKDTDAIFKQGFERKYHNITDLISSFGFNLYQVCICVEDGMILATPEFHKYSRTQQLKLINHNLSNPEYMIDKALKINKNVVAKK